MPKCPYCKLLTHYFLRITTENIEKNSISWKLSVSKTVEVWCPYCWAELGEEDLRELEIPAELLE